MVRQFKEETQHSEGESRFSKMTSEEEGSDRLFAGKDERTISWNRFTKSESPICGVLAFVAPAGEHKVYPCRQPPPRDSNMDGAANAAGAINANKS